MAALFRDTGIFSLVKRFGPKLEDMPKARRIQLIKLQNCVFSLLSHIIDIFHFIFKRLTKNFKALVRKSNCLFGNVALDNNNTRQLSINSAKLLHRI